jgi:hypothetical protein
MQTTIAAACLTLLLWIGPASAQTVHSLTFSVHKDVELTEAEVEDALQHASRLLTQDNKCDVTFQLGGRIKFFAPGTPKDISDKDDLEAVHREVADVKIVNSIGFCIGEKREFLGCAWRRDGPKTVIIARDALRSKRGIVLAHEFGHVSGLPHRAEERALMFCNLDFHRINVNETECSCFRAGPGGCKIPEPNPAVVCPKGQE